MFSKCSQFWWNFLRFMHLCTYKKICRFLDWKSWLAGFLNFEVFTSHFLKNPKILLVFLIGPFLIRTDWVYAPLICIGLTYLSTLWYLRHSEKWTDRHHGLSLYLAQRGQRLFEVAPKFYALLSYKIVIFTEWKFENFLWK